MRLQTIRPKFQIQSPKLQGLNRRQDVGYFLGLDTCLPAGQAGNLGLGAFFNAN